MKKTFQLVLLTAITIRPERLFAASLGELLHRNADALILHGVLGLVFCLLLAVGIAVYFRRDRYLKAVRYSRRFGDALALLPVRMAAVDENGEYLFAYNQHIFHTVEQGAKFEPERMPSNRRISEQVLKDGMRKVVAFNIDEEYFRSEVTFLPRRIYGKKVAFWITYNLTDIYVMQQEILNQAAWFRHSLDSIYDAIVTTDEHGIVTLMNDHAEWLLGSERKNALGRPLHEFLDKAFPHAAKLLEDAVSGALQGRPQFEVSLEQKSQNAFISLSITPLRMRERRTSGLVLVGHDLTAEHKLQAELRKENERLHEAEAELGNAIEQLKNHIRYGKVLNSSLQRILQTNELDYAFPRMFKSIGPMLRADRITLFRYSGSMLIPVCAWYNPACPEAQQLAPSFHSALLNGHRKFNTRNMVSILSEHTQNETERNFMKQHHILSGMASGVWLREKPWGAITMDFMRETQEFGELDRDLIVNIAALICCIAERREYLLLRAPDAEADLYIPEEDRV